MRLRKIREMQRHLKGDGVMALGKRTGVAACSSRSRNGKTSITASVATTPPHIESMMR
jgi:hypothetical protein